MIYLQYLQYFGAKTSSPPAGPMEEAFINAFGCAWEQGGHQHSQAFPEPGQDLGDYKTGENQKTCCTWAQSLAKAGTQGAGQQISALEMRRTITIMLGVSQLVASRTLPPGFFQLLVRLVLPEGKQRGQVQKVKFLMAAPTQAPSQEVSCQTEAMWCS